MNQKEKYVHDQGHISRGIFKYFFSTHYLSNRHIKGSRLSKFPVGQFLMRCDYHTDSAVLVIQRTSKNRLTSRHKESAYYHDPNHALFTLKIFRLDGVSDRMVGHISRLDPVSEADLKNAQLLHDYFDSDHAMKNECQLRKCIYPMRIRFYGDIKLVDGQDVQKFELVLGVAKERENCFIEIRAVLSNGEYDVLLSRSCLSDIHKGVLGALNQDNVDHKKQVSFFDTLSKIRDSFGDDQVRAMLEKSGYFDIQRSQLCDHLNQYKLFVDSEG